MAANDTGIGAATRVSRVRNFLDTLEATHGQGIFATDMGTVRAREAELAKYLGATDYAKQLTDAQGMGKLQLALALAQRGFAAAGAPPMRGETPVSTLSRELLSPLAGDAGAVATQMMQQKQALNAAQRQEERQLKLAALQDVKTQATDRRELALKLMPDPGEEERGLWEGVKFLVQRNDAGTDWEFPDPQNPIQLLRTKDLGKPINARTRKEHNLLEGQAMLSYGELPDALKGIVGTGTDTSDYKDHLVVVDVATDKPIIDDQGNWIEVTRGPGNQLFRFGTNVPYIRPGNTRLQPISAFNVTAGGKTDAERAAGARLGLLQSNMYQIQKSKLPGDHSAYSARSGLFFDQSAYLAGEFAFKYIPLGTAADDRSKDVTITNPAVIQLINKKMASLADTILRSDFGSSNQKVKSKRLADAVHSMLSVTPATLFGVQAIGDVGVDSSGKVVGYDPSQEAFSPAVVAANAATAMGVLKLDADANAVKTMEPVPRPDNEQDFNKSWGRMRIATGVFPAAFSNTGQAGTEQYDQELVQRRLDIEKELLGAPLVFGASPTEHRILIQELASEQAAARDTVQNSVSASRAKEAFELGLEFRAALLDFKNAAAETGVEGFITGRIAGTLARIGLADWVAGAGREHWDRLSIASERFQEGISRRVGKDFGDDRISNADALAYKKLVPDIRTGAKYNKVLVADGLRRVNRDLTDLMAYGGKVGWTERDLERAAEAGVDFSALNTQMNWHGHGFYGESRYSTSRQYTPTLSDAQRNVLRTSGQLKDTMYGGQYTLPNVNFLTDNIPMFTLGQDETDTQAAVPATTVSRKGPIQFETHLKNLAAAAKVDIEEMRRRVVRGIIKYNIWRDSTR
jgi:hypothetical protein